MPSRRFLGVTVQPPYIQSEGVNSVLDGLADAGVTAVAIAPAVSEAIDELDGRDDAGSSEELPRREPPVDAGEGSVRVIERKLWGKEEVLIRPAPSYEPDLDLYRGLRYQPRPADALSAREGHVIQECIDGAHARGMRAYFQVSAVQIPGLHDDDLPRLPNGGLPRRRMVYTAAVASHEVRAYVCARAKDMLAAYPEIDGLRHDWPEHPPYCLGDAFLDFGPHARAAADRLGFDFEEMRRAADALYRSLETLTNADLEPLLDPSAAAELRERTVASRRGLGDALRFKAALTETYVRELRQAMDGALGGAGREKELSPNAFPPPFSLLSGMDFGRVARWADSINMKLYTMHWPLIVYFYASELLEHNANLDESITVQALAALADIEDDGRGRSLSDYRYPPPDQPHRAGDEAQRRKIRQAVAATEGRADLLPVVHGYGPLGDFTRRLKVAWEAGTPGIWVNRYCYLGPAKLDAIKALGNTA